MNAADFHPAYCSDPPLTEESSVYVVQVGAENHDTHTGVMRVFDSTKGEDTGARLYIGGQQIMRIEVGLSSLLKNLDYRVNFSGQLLFQAYDQRTSRIYNAYVKCQTPMVPPIWYGDFMETSG